MSYALQRTSLRPTATTGLGFTMPASVLDHMDRVNGLISGMDMDIQKDLVSQHGVVSMAFLNEWTDFTSASRDVADNLDVAPPSGWRWFYQDYSGIVSRLFHSDAINKRTGEFEYRFMELYDKFKALGGQPSVARPIPGVTLPTPTPEERELLPWGKIALLGGALLGGYWLLNMGGMLIVKKALSSGGRSR